VVCVNQEVNQQHFCADGAQVQFWAEKGVKSRAGGYIFPFQAGLAGAIEKIGGERKFKHKF
jgi:hypothetical protein